MRRLQDLVATSSPGSVVLQADPRLGKSTGRMVPQTRHPGNALLPLDLLVDRLLGSALVEATVETANTVEAATAVPHHGSSPEAMTEAKTTTADTVADMVDTAVMEVEEEEEEEATARVHLLEALRPGCSRKRTRVTAPLEWTATVFRRHPHRLLPASHLRPLLAICRRPLRHHPSSGRQSPILTILEKKNSRCALGICDRSED